MSSDAYYLVDIVRGAPAAKLRVLVWADKTLWTRRRRELRSELAALGIVLRFVTHSRAHVTNAKGCTIELLRCSDPHAKGLLDIDFDIVLLEQSMTTDAVALVLLPLLLQQRKRAVRLLRNPALVAHLPKDKPRAADELVHAGMRPARLYGSATLVTWAQLGDAVF